MKSDSRGPQAVHQLLVTALSPGATRGVLACGPLRLPCALGRSGRKAGKREGDGATPIGSFALRKAFYRPDRLVRPRTLLPLSPLRKDDGWCDAPGDRNYNRHVRHPYPASAEHLWRDDGLYDVVVVLGHNERPRVQGRGSAVFMHVAGPGFTATAGCVALRLPDLLRVLEYVSAGALVRIRA
jgi:L,D-peptidoglycan transpeptidase YkuD (ErfK/YbiS/YcfS/YnhG family)